MTKEILCGLALLFIHRNILIANSSDLLDERFGQL